MAGNEQKIDATTGELLKSGSDALDLFYVENKLRIYLEILTQELITNNITMIIKWSY